MSLFSRFSRRAVAGIIVAAFGHLAAIAGPIAGYPTAATLNGTEKVIGTQSGATVNILTSQIQALTLTNLPAGPVFTSGANGLAPASGGGTTNFLRADGTWHVPSLSGALLSANNLSDVANAATSLSNLGGAPNTVVTSGANGLAPATGGGTTNFLRADATWADPLSGTLRAVNNLSDVNSVSLARTNLGLGSAALQNSGTAGANLGLLSGANTYSAIQTFFTSTTGSASINIPKGSVPTSPNNGDIWTTSGGAFVRIAGSTLQFATPAGTAVTSFNTRTGAISLTSGDVTTALTYTPLAPANNLSDVSTPATALTNLGAAPIASPAFTGSTPTSAGTALVLTTDSRFSALNQNSQSTSYTLVIGDGGKEIYHPSADTTARTITIPANGSVAFPVATKVEIVNDCSAGVLTIAITSDTIEWFPSGTTGSRSLAACGMATLTKVTSTKWTIVGTGLSLNGDWMRRANDDPLPTGLVSYDLAA